MKKEVSLEVLTHDDLFIDDYLVEMCQSGFLLKEIDLGVHGEGLGVSTLHRSQYNVWVERAETARSFYGFPTFKNSLDIWSERRDFVSHVLDYAQLFGKEYSGVIYNPAAQRIVTSFYGTPQFDPDAPVPMGRLAFGMREKLRLLDGFGLDEEKRAGYSSLLDDYKVAFTPSGHIVTEEEIFGCRKEGKE